MGYSREDVAPDEGGDGKPCDGGWWRSLHHQLIGGARAQMEALPEESESEGIRTEVPAARAVCLTGTYDFVGCLLLMIPVMGRFKI